MVNRTRWGAFIGGQWVLPDDATWFSVLEPATGGHLAEVVAADQGLVDLAVRDSRHAYEGEWGKLTPRERGALLRKAAALIREHADELGPCSAHEVG